MQPLTAIEYFNLCNEDREHSRLLKTPKYKEDFKSMLEFAEDYADYICDFENKH